MKFKKKSIVINAVQFTDGFYGDPDIPVEFKEACCTKNDVSIGQTLIRPHVHTLEGIHWITMGDWIVKGIKGEFYPVKSEIFAQTYEFV